jgi:hypothetical protein
MSPSETLWMLEEACGKVTVNKVRVYEWHKCVRDGHVSVNDLRCELPSPSTSNENVQCVHVLRAFRKFQQK